VDPIKLPWITKQGHLDPARFPIDGIQFAREGVAKIRMLRSLLPQKEIRRQQLKSFDERNPWGLVMF
jgi:hypothetical protein